MAGFNFAALDKAVRSQPTYALGFALFCNALADSIDENAENPKDMRNLAINLRKQSPILGMGIREVANRPEAEPEVTPGNPPAEAPHFGSIPPINSMTSKHPGEGELRDETGTLIPAKFPAPKAPAAAPEFPAPRKLPVSPFGGTFKAGDKVKFNCDGDFAGHTGRTGTVERLNGDTAQTCDVIIDGGGLVAAVPFTSLLPA